MVDGSDFAQVLVEAADIANAVSQPLTSGHVLLALFTSENSAQVLLKERGIDEDRLLESMTSAPRESDGLLREVCERSREIARSCGSREASCLHFLIAVTRMRCAAQELLVRVGMDLTQVRNTALSYFLSGRMPRRLQPSRAATRIAERISPSRPVGAPPMPLPGAVVSMPRMMVEEPPRAPPPPTLAPFSARDLIDASDDPETTRLEELYGMSSSAPQTVAFDAPVSRYEEDDGLAPISGASLVPAAPSHPFALDPALYPMLTSLGRNLSLAARRGELDPVVGRAREIEEVIDVLGKRRTNNPCLVGEPGVGKTAVVEGVAHQLAALRGGLGDRILVELDMATLLAGTQLRGSFSEKLNGLKEEVRRADGRIVVFIDEIHTLVGAGSTGEGPQDAANELKSAMSRGEFPCIGATTHEEFRKYIAQDPALERRFTPVQVNEPSLPETVQILKGIIGRYEEHHGLRYDPQALEAAASLSSKYITDRFLPDKAISIIDLAGSRSAREGKETVGPDDVARVVAKVAGLPAERLLMSDSERLLRLESDLASRVIGHGDSVTRLARVIRRNYAGFSSRRPMGSFLFLGPTGVGKTEMARALAEVLFGSKDALIRLDMSEMSEAHGVSRLIGAPAGYVGYGEGGQLTEPVRRRPSSVIVLDEIEKAHREIWMLLLQVLDEGRLTDGKGRHIDFSNTVIVLTSNLGAEAFGPAPRVVGFGASSEASSASGGKTDRAKDGAKRALPPELWNRIDERLVFQPLQQLEVAKIATLMLAESSKRLASEKGIIYSAGDDVVTLLLSQGGFDPELGARPMRQTVQRLVEAPLAERILSGEFHKGDHIQVAVASGELAFRRARVN